MLTTRLEVEWSTRSKDNWNESSARDGGVDEQFRDWTSCVLDELEKRDLSSEKMV